MSVYGNPIISLSFLFIPIISHYPQSQHFGIQLDIYSVGQFVLDTTFIMMWILRFISRKISQIWLVFHWVTSLQNNFTQSIILQLSLKIIPPQKRSKYRRSQTLGIFQPAMSDEPNITSHSWHRSSSQAWNPARVTNHDFGSYLFPLRSEGFPREGPMSGPLGNGEGGRGGKRGGRVGEAEFSGIWGWAAEIICTCVKSTGVPWCSWLVFERRTRFDMWPRFPTPRSFSNATFVFNTSVDRMQLLPCSRGVPTSLYKLIVTCLSKNVSGDFSSLL